MPAHKSALKRIKQSKKNHDRNVATKSALKTMRKEFLSLLSDKKEDALKKLPLMQSALDKASKRGIFHSKKSARLKSRLMQRLAATAPTAVKV